MHQLLEGGEDDQRKSHEDGHAGPGRDRQHTTTFVPGPVIDFQEPSSVAIIPKTPMEPTPDWAILVICRD